VLQCVAAKFVSVLQLVQCVYEDTTEHVPVDTKCVAVCCSKVFQCVAACMKIPQNMFP